MEGGHLLFSCTDSAVIEALKVINKAAIETGFPGIPTILESEKEGGAYLRRAFV